MIHVSLHIELHRCESRLLCRGPPRPYSRKAAPSHLPFDGCRIETVEMDVYPVKSRCLQRPGKLWQRFFR